MPTSVPAVGCLSKMNLGSYKLSPHSFASFFPASVPASPPASWLPTAPRRTRTSPHAAPQLMHASRHHPSAPCGPTAPLTTLGTPTQLKPPCLNAAHEPKLFHSLHRFAALCGPRSLPSVHCQLSRWTSAFQLVTIHVDMSWPIKGKSRKCASASSAQHGRQAGKQASKPAVGQQGGSVAGYTKSQPAGCSKQLDWIKSGQVVKREVSSPGTSAWLAWA